LAGAFPNVKVVYFERVHFTNETVECIIWQKVESLEIHNCNGLPYSRLNTPRLTHFMLCEELDNESAAFVGRHSSITHLEVELSSEVFCYLFQSDIASRTTTLDDLRKLIRAYLEYLDVLRVYSWSGDNTGFFRAAVRAFHNRTKREEDDGGKEGKSFRILVTEDIPLENLEWYNSELLASSVREISQIDRWGYSGRLYTFRWL
jgi:hypothetical protein